MAPPKVWVIPSQVSIRNLKNIDYGNNCDTYPKLVFIFSEMGFWVMMTHFLDFFAEYASINLSITTCQSFKNSIMNKYILLLQGEK